VSLDNLPAAGDVAGGFPEVPEFAQQTIDPQAKRLGGDLLGFPNAWFGVFEVVENFQGFRTYLRTK
jgi:hypothetical protein